MSRIYLKLTKIKFNTSLIFMLSKESKNLIRSKFGKSGKVIKEEEVNQLEEYKLKNYKAIK